MAATQAGGRLEVASYREVFDLERRIYRIDRLRLNPAGIPLRGAIYFVAALLIAAAVSELPLAGWLASRLPWYLRYGLLPAALAAAGATLRVEGRPLHLAIRGLWLGALRARYLRAFEASAAPGARWCPPPIIVIPDGSGRHPRRFRVTGPGAVTVRCSHELVEWRRSPLERRLGAADLTLRLARSETTADPANPGRVLRLGAETRLEIEPHPGSACR